MSNIDTVNTLKKTNEAKREFLSSAISDISAYIQLADTKVSIIMATVVALIVGFFSCYDSFKQLVAPIKPYSWQEIALLILATLLSISTISVFVFGILTIRSHVSNIKYKSKWFLPQSTKKYSFDTYKADVLSMNDEDIIINMAAELYKLNDINRQKQATNRWVLRSFSTSLILFIVIIAMLVLSTF